MFYLLQRSAKLKLFAYLTLLVPMLFIAQQPSAATTVLPEGTKGWGYYTPGLAPLGYVGSPEEACRLSALNHMGTPLVDMRVNHSSPLSIDCKYPHFLRVGGVNWYFTTSLTCESGYKATPEGSCIKDIEPAPPITCKQGQPGYSKGNPVIVSSGAKVQSEADPVGAASNLLRVKRTYRTSRSFRDITSGGLTWSFWFDDTFVVIGKRSDGRPTQIERTSGDGTYFQFVWNSSTQKYVSTYDKSATLEALTPAYDDWLLTYGEQANRYQKRTMGEDTRLVLVKSQKLDGSTQNYSYKPDTFLVESITDEAGRLLVVSWGGNNQVAAISGPEGSVHYEYDTPWGNYPSFAQGMRLISARYVDVLGASLGIKQYHYEDTYNNFLLTGITEENGDRFASYEYDTKGRVTLSEHAGGAYRYRFTYPDDNNRIITDPLGAQRTSAIRYINKMGVVTGESQPGGSGCAPGSSSISHESASSDNILSQTDFNGYKTCYRYDSRGLQINQASGLLSTDTCPASGTSTLTSLLARRTSTQWHPDFPLRTAFAEAGRITNYLYNGQVEATGNLAECAPGAVLPNGKPLPLLCSVTVQATIDVNGASGFSAQGVGAPRVWSYTYDSNGKLLTSTGPQDKWAPLGGDSYLLSGYYRNALFWRSCKRR